ncbi:hypothetical protein I7I51_06159 [Histoplasma capsulatum]|uniref:Uncharacterized protein n=1 Tax=Ajellomyces capsulatus TaxID=5037 RepID=A0A8A1MMK5_AJECA|nr:hypothetical protein I7I51_06159 [Histoplasma capsulatum]
MVEKAVRPKRQRSESPASATRASGIVEIFWQELRAASICFLGEQSSHHSIAVEAVDGDNACLASVESYFERSVNSFLLHPQATTLRSNIMAPTILTHPD